MKRFLKEFFLNAAVLAGLGWLYSGLEVSFKPVDFLLTSLILTLVIKVAKPVFELVLLPVNLLTLGLFRWLKIVIAFGLAVYLAPGVKLQSFYFSGFTLDGLIVQPMTFSVFFSLLIAALLFYLGRQTVDWLFKTK